MRENKNERTKGKTKMKARVLAGAVIAATAMAMTGCVVYPGIVADNSKPLEQNGYTIVSEEPVTSSMSQWGIFFITFPPIFDSDIADIVVNAVNPSPSQLLYRKCLSKAGADALIEYSMDTKTIMTGWVNYTKTTLSGIPVKEKK